MHAEFWHQRWQSNQIGFHRQAFHSLLIKYFPKLKPGTNTGTVFVPLCGKSNDMQYLAEQGCNVLGVEIDRSAIAAFFSEHDLSPQVLEQHNFECWQAGLYTLLCGDFFALQPVHTQSINAVYDRAALIALPPDMRVQYAAAMQRLVPVGMPMLLITLEYDQAEMDGPPFAVSRAEIERLFAAWDKLEFLENAAVLDQHPNFRDKGLTALHESVYLLQR